MHSVTCLKVKNSEFWSISDPNGFRKTFVDCTANPILLMRKLRLGNQVPSLRWHDWEVETPYETTKVVGVNPWLYNPWALLTLPWSMGGSPGPKLRALGPRTPLQGHSFLPQQPEDTRVPASPPCSCHQKELPSEGHSPTQRRAAPGVNREEPWCDSKAVGTG